MRVIAVAPAAHRYGLVSSCWPYGFDLPSSGDWLGGLDASIGRQCGCLFGVFVGQVQGDDEASA